MISDDRDDPLGARYFQCSSSTMFNSGAKDAIRHLHSDYTPIVDRQDSLMLCQQLQEKDGYDHFMDQNMDLTPYLSDLQTLEVDSEDLEPFRDKQRILESDIRAQQNIGHTLPLYADLTNSGTKGMNPLKEEVHIENSPLASLAETVTRTENIQGDFMDGLQQRQKFDLMSVKKEPSDYVEIAGFTPSTKPRKYTLKPEAEKMDPLYRLKREKNNDAVRRSRSKAKQQQKLKEEQLRALERRVEDYHAELKKRDERIKELETNYGKLRCLESENGTLSKNYKEAMTEIDRLRREVSMLSARSFCRHCARQITYDD